MRALRHKLIWAALLASVLMAVTQLWRVYAIHHENQWLSRLQQGHEISIEKVMTAAPEIRLARAVYLHNKQRFSEAIDTLSLIVEQGDREFQAKSRYNLGNTYLSQALAELEAGRINQAMPLLMLAKQAFRQALRLDSGFWDAKYNLELAMRLLPEFDRISQSQPDDDAVKPSQLWTTVPGFPRGLP
ncbi:MAG: MxaK protein [Methylomonas sp.]|jgi:mxaK protein|uniref:MxaK protein n=1 Tax=Methylomonas sp. TaxID=418 RepID=UPI0025CD5F5C|nr:MxaK protein [Methylomonas sp.]MCK9607023.1 MxaK protein [Methylomonas sp.]